MLAESQDTLVLVCGPTLAPPQVTQKTELDHLIKRRADGLYLCPKL